MKYHRTTPIDDQYGLTNGYGYKTLSQKGCCT